VDIVKTLEVKLDFSKLYANEKQKFMLETEFKNHYIAIESIGVVAQLG
jgi:hypothetical protein